MRRGTAHMESPERCWGCAACVKACPTEAIALFLGEDMGGLGGRMTVRTQSACLYWRVRLPGGGETIIVTDSRDANKY
jgi:adenylylsulfate reductase subunit B